MVLLVLVAPVVALVMVLFLARVEQGLAVEAEEASRLDDPARHPSA